MCYIYYDDKEHQTAVLCNGHALCFLSGTIFFCGLGSSDGIATGYGMDGQGIESHWGRDFPHLSRPAQGPTQPPVQWVLGFSRGYKAAEA
jgi:hypothetical protein